MSGETLFPIMDVGIAVPTATYSTELDSSGSWIVVSPDLGKTWNVLEQSNDGLLDIAASSLGNNTGVVSSVLGRVVYTLDAGKSWETSVTPLFGSQSIQRSRDGSKMYCGAGGNKISVSSNKGITWNHHEVVGLNNGSRYCALPTATTWYVTAGFWVEDDEDDEDMFHLNSRASIHKKTGEFSWKFNRRHERGSNNAHYPGEHRRRMQEQFMWAELWKTDDAGANWTRLYASDNKFYFNAIDCCDAKTCYAVAEGDQEAGSNEPGTRVLMTNDGENFKVVYYDPLDSSSLMTVHCISDMEAYAGGGDITGGRDFAGTFLHTTDGGQTWTNTSVKAPAMWMDMTDDAKYGVASGISKTSGGVEYSYQ